MIHVMSDQVSFGSQFQYVPQALFAQMDPVTMQSVRNRKPRETARYVIVSSICSSGKCMRANALLCSYVKSVKLNGKAYNKLYITHADLLAGGKLEFQMASTPNKSRGVKTGKPYSLSD